MKIRLIFLAFLLPLLIACSSSSDLDQALCRDLDTGLTLRNIKPSDMAPETFAQHVYTATEHECPRHLNNIGVRTFLRNWGYQ